MNTLKLIGLLFGLYALTGCTTLPQAVMHRDPLSAEEYTALGTSYLKKNEKPAAARQFEAALRKDRKHMPALIALGNIAFEEGDTKKARKYFRKAQKIKPEDASGVNNLAMVDLAEGKDLDQALKNVENALPTAGPMRPYLLDTLVNIAIRQDRVDDAKRLLDQARKEAPPNDSEYLKNLAVTEEKLAKLVK